MGFSTLLDILGSSMIGGFLLLIMIRVQANVVTNTYTYGGDFIVQANLVNVVQMLEDDFRKIGYCADYTKIPTPTLAIRYADSTRITFLTDVDPYDGVVDSITYYMGTTSEIPETPNPRDKPIYRKLNTASALSANFGISSFKMTYYNVLGNKISSPVSVPGEIFEIQLDLILENPAAYDEKSSNAYWRQVRLAARNLRNR